MALNRLKGVSADRDATMRLAANDKKGKIWLHRLSVGYYRISVARALNCYFTLKKWIKLVDDFFMQGMPLFYGVWGDGKCNICNPYHYHLV